LQKEETMLGTHLDRRWIWSLAVIGLVLQTAACQRSRDPREELGDAAKQVAREEANEARSTDAPVAQPVADAQAPPARSSGQAPSATQRTPAPDFRLPDLDGKEVRLSSYKGKVVMVNFWATWCPPCRAEIPDFIELQRELGPKGLAILGISFDQGGPGTVRAFAQQQRINYQMLMGAPEVARAYGGVQNIPTTFLLDKEGRIVASRTGVAAKQYWRQAILELLNES
jgi:cytochrome c biogenesis protein CcmG/thiol:disulfide interchange protein DsbE